MSNDHPVWDKPGTLKRLMDNEALLAQILSIFFSQAESRLITIREDIQMGRTEQARATTHGLKGSAGDVGAMRLFYHLHHLEQALARDARNALALYQQVVDEYQLFERQAG